MSIEIKIAMDDSSQCSLKNALSVKGMDKLFKQ